MSERDVVDRTAVPATMSTLRTDLEALGIGRGDTLVVHSSLSAIGWVAGGPQAVVTALLNGVGDDGTVTMPGHSSDWSEPAQWENPPVPDAWWPTIRAEWPAFDPHLTPLRSMGAVAEALHRHPRTLRSGHPRVSHLANGATAASIVASHPLGSGFGDESPLGRLYDLDATVLLVGVGHVNNTSLHLAEERAEWPGRTTSRHAAAVLVAGERRWVEYDELDGDTDDFEAVGADFERRTGLVRRGTLGLAPTMAVPMRALVDHAAAWFTANRGRMDTAAHVQAFNLAVTSGNWDPFVGRFADDAVLEFVGPPVGPFVGIEAIAAAYAANPPDDTIAPAGEPRQEGAELVVPYRWVTSDETGTMRFTERDGRIGRLVVTFD